MIVAKHNLVAKNNKQLNGITFTADIRQATDKNGQPLSDADSRKRAAVLGSFSSIEKAKVAHLFKNLEKKVDPPIAAIPKANTLQPIVVNITNNDDKLV